MPNRPLSWTPTSIAKDRPAYIAIAEAIADDIRAGRLKANAALPPQRKLADALGYNFTTISRAYAEAQRRGLIEARVGRGTFVRPSAAPHIQRDIARPAVIDLSMNLPPEPDSTELLARMESGMKRLCTDIRGMLRYQTFGGSPEDRDMAVQWLARRGVRSALNKVLICPGTHSALNALFALLAGHGGRICCENITYPGARALAALHSISLLGLTCDAQGVTPEAFEAACRDHAPAALYLNPTLQNPTTVTVPLERRESLIEVARRYGVPIIEDDPYSLLLTDAPPSFHALAPDITYYVGGLSKTLGAGLRIAYLAAPDVRQLPRLSAALRAVSVMAPPISMAIATEWIADGTADALVQFIRGESVERQRIAREVLGAADYLASEEGFHLWLPLPEGWSRVSFAAHLRSSGIGVVTSDAFLVSGTAVEAVRICLGGVASRDDVRHAMELVGSALSHPPAIYSSIV
ncbi:aminotransferase-like domain-containing protein [Nitrogeniibacter aestuarii]|uniref:aminotransferase-like domain-containing protein n=1 Tax=Nitrogeniibacter aestuarii TaxID=2815343 RepID=UPI001E5004B7|nr:PLP-dependent aminotransferase family protein [Nitrogeniibacter aestuarii]